MGLALILTLVSLGLSYLALSRERPLCWRFDMSTGAPSTGAPRFERVFDYAAATGQAHSPALLIEEDGFSIAWFEGSEEAQADVDIRAVAFRRTGDTWQAGAPAPLVTRAGLGRVFEPPQLVVTLGNTVQNDAAPGALFATVVSVGGWAMASVADVRIEEGRPAQARKLNLSPFLNRSYLVKSPQVRMADGSFALPAYFEMGQTYGAFVRLDPDGRVRDTRRIRGNATRPIQPMIVPLSETRAVAFLRDFNPSGRLLISRTEDGGQSWSPADVTDIPNPSAPVAALGLTGGRILMAMNDDAGKADSLRLALSDDEGQSWRAIHTLEKDGGDARYPMLGRLPGGDILLSYSHDTKGGIRACLFNDAWVNAQ